MYSLFKQNKIINDSKKGNGKHVLLGVIGAQIKIAQQPFPDGAPAQHLHPLTEPQRLFRDQPEEIFCNLGVAETGVAAPLGDFVIGDKADFTVRIRRYKDGIRIAGKGKTFSEQPPFPHPFQDGAAAVFVGTDQGCHALEHDAQPSGSFFVVTDHRTGREPGIHRMKAMHHPLTLSRGHIFK